MNERATDRHALALYAANYPAQVQAAGRQLAVAAQLNQDLERRRFVGLLKRIDSKHAAAFLSRRAALDGDVIERFADCWVWGKLSMNVGLPWSLELVERFEDRWKWWGLSMNAALPWSLELIERFEDRWKWWGLSMNAALPWSLELIERFEDRWDWVRLSSNTALPWSLDLIERFEDRWHWRGSGLSGNAALPWSLELIERFEDRWDWRWRWSGYGEYPDRLELYENKGKRLGVAY